MSNPFRVVGVPAAVSRVVTALAVASVDMDPDGPEAERTPRADRRSDADRTVVLVDADTVAGWRRVTPSFAQLTEAVTDLRLQAPDATVAIVGDPALKWALSSADQRLLDDEINHQRIVLAPAGSKDGHVGFIAEAVRRAERLGLRAVVVTDRVVPGCPIVRIRRDGTTWCFDLDHPQLADSERAQPVVRRRRRRA